MFAAVIAGVGLAPFTAHAQDAAADDVIVTGTTATATKTGVAGSAERKNSPTDVHARRTAEDGEEADNETD